MKITTVTEDYVSFETACLLKDKGFDQKCEKVYMQGELKWASCCMEGESFVDREDIRLAANYENWIEYTQGDYAVLAPTLNIAMKWLREKKGIAVVPILSSVLDNEKFLWDIEITIAKTNESYHQGWIYEHYEDAVEAAIKYCLENLINT